MTITTTEQILLIILAAALAVFLILGIILLVYLIRVAKAANRIVDKAEQIAEKASHVASFFEKTTSKVTFAGLIGNIIESVSNHKKEKK